MQYVRLWIEKSEPAGHTNFLIASSCIGFLEQRTVDRERPKRHGIDEADLGLLDDKKYPHGEAISGFRIEWIHGAYGSDPTSFTCEFHDEWDLAGLVKHAASSCGTGIAGYGGEFRNRS